MTRVNGKTNAEKCIEANAKAYKRKPVFIPARKAKKMLKQMDLQWQSWTKQTDFAML